VFLALLVAAAATAATIGGASTQHRDASGVPLPWFYTLVDGGLEEVRVTPFGYGGSDTVRYKEIDPPGLAANLVLDIEEEAEAQCLWVTFYALTPGLSTAYAWTDTIPKLLSGQAATVFFGAPSAWDKARIWIKASGSSHAKALVAWRAELW